jgi:hypothetical protein
MKFKSHGQEETNLTAFDLLSDKETSNVKVLAYALAKDAVFFNLFMEKLIGIKGNFKKEFDNVIIKTEERVNDKDRLDLDIKTKNEHIVIEAKIGEASVPKEQKQGYVERAFENDGGKKGYFVSLTQLHFAEELDNSKKIIFKNIVWQDILDLRRKVEIKDAEVKRAVEFLSRRIKMNVRQIMIQDVNEEGQKLFLDNYVYMRDATDKQQDIPLYFAPYFTNKTANPGISYMAEVLFVYVLKKSGKDALCNSLSEFIDSYNKNKDNKDNKIDEKDLLRRWTEAIELGKEGKDKKFYFLKEPFELPQTLKKDTGQGKGVGKDWIAKMIGIGRTVSFEDFLRQIKKQSKA